jgi:hypothetical protein
MSLKYGRGGSVSLEIDSGRIVASPPPPHPSARIAEELEQALSQPLEFPPLEQAVIPGDRVVLALDRYTPQAAALVAGVWEVLKRRQVRAEDVVVLQPAERGGPALADPRAELPDAVRDIVAWKVHDPAAKDACMYLASSSSGERIYLAREVVVTDGADRLRSDSRLPRHDERLLSGNVDRGGDGSRTRAGAS